MLLLLKFPPGRNFPLIGISSRKNLYSDKILPPLPLCRNINPSMSQSEESAIFKTSPIVVGYNFLITWDFTRLPHLTKDSSGLFERTLSLQAPPLFPHFCVNLENNLFFMLQKASSAAAGPERKTKKAGAITQLLLYNNSGSWYLVRVRSLSRLLIYDLVFCCFPCLFKGLFQ